MARTRNEEAFTARRAEILRVAERLFVEQGFHQTGMAAICDAAGMSPGALYRYFPSKADIIRAVVAEERAGAAAMFDALEQANDFPARLVSALDGAIMEVSDTAYARLALEISAEGARDKDVGALLVEAENEALRQEAEALVARDQRAGLDPPDPPVRITLHHQVARELIT
jgi:AcrR family transcriptional regulator